MESLDSTYGALLIGLVIGTVLYGATVLQTFFYYRTYPKDPITTKALVALIWVLDTVQLIFCTVALYWYLIINYQNREALGKATWSLSLQTDCNGLIGVIVECFFARRVWILSKNIILVFAIVVLAFIHFGLGVVFTVEEFILVDVSKFSKLIWVTTTGLGSAAAADVLIAVSLCYYLLKARTGFYSTDNLITTLIAYSLTTGLITSILAFVCVITFATMPTNYIWLAFFWIMGKCYVNSLLASLSDVCQHVPSRVLTTSFWNGRLNSRGFLRDRIRPRDGIDGSGPPQSPRELNSRFSEFKVADVRSKRGSRGGIAVNVQMQTYSKTDEVYDGSERSPVKPIASGTSD